MTSEVFVKPILEPTIIVDNDYYIPANIYKNIIYNGIGGHNIYLPPLAKSLQGQPYMIMNIGGNDINIRTVNTDYMQLNNITSSQLLILGVNGTVNIIYDDNLWIVASITDNTGGVNFNVDPIAIGIDAGLINQNIGAIAIGSNTGLTSQSGIAIGNNAGLLNQRGIAIGVESGQIAQNSNAVAIGYQAGKTSQIDSVIINASGAELSSGNNGIYINPIRSNITTNILNYDPINKEITQNTSTIPTITKYITFNDTCTSTVKQYQQYIEQDLTISEKNATAVINGYPSGNFNYTFGKVGVTRYLMGGHNVPNNGSNAVKYSYNGKKWFNTNTAINGVSGLKLSGLIYNGFVYIALGNFLGGTPSISVNGITFQNLVFLPTGTMYTTPASGGNITMAINSFVPNAVSNTTTTATTNPSPNLFIITGPGNFIYYSFDGLAYGTITVSFGTTSAQGRCVIYNGFLWVAVGGSTSVALSSKIFYSYNGITWTSVNISGPSAFTYANSISWNGTVFIMLVMSTDQILYATQDNLLSGSWTVATNPGIGTPYSVDSNGYMSVAIGTSGVAYTYNGINWTSGTLPPTATITAFSQVSWTGNMWAINTGGAIKYLYSYNGITWTSQGVSNAMASNTNGCSPTTKLALTPGSIVFSADGVLALGAGSTSDTLRISFTKGNSYQSPSFYSGRFSVAGYAACWNGYFWVAVGDDGATGGNIKYSYNGYQWYNTVFLPADLAVTSNSFGANKIGRGVSWNGEMFVAVGDDTNIKYSYDGVNWINVAVGFTTGNGIAWGKDKWVAVGTGGATIRYSLNGKTWLNATGGFTTTGRGVVYDNNMWIALGQDTTQNNRIKYSYDGITWLNTAGTTFTANGGYAAAWNGDTWVAVGAGGGTTSINWSKNGIVWSNTGVSGGFTTNGAGIAWNGINWIAAGSGTFNTLFSADGRTWNSGPLSFTNGYGVAWNKSNVGKVYIQQPIIAVGDGPYSIAISEYGYSWTGVSSIFTIGRGVCWNGNLWVAVGEGSNTIAWSVDGYEWNGLGNSIFSTSARAVCWMGDKFIAVGNGTNQVAYSVDGKTWFGLGNNYFTTSGYAAFYNGEFVVISGDGDNSATFAIWSSITGLNWTSRSQLLLSQGNGITAAGNRWTVVGVAKSGNPIINSYDLINWSNTATMPATTTVNGVYFNGSAYIAVGAAATNNIMYSADGAVWAAATNSFAVNGNAVTWTGTRWIATGSEAANSPSFRSPVTNLQNFVVIVRSTTAISPLNGIFNNIYGISGNSKIGGCYIPSAYRLKKGDTMGMISPNMYNGVFKSMSVSFSS